MKHRSVWHDVAVAKLLHDIDAKSVWQLVDRVGSTIDIRAREEFVARFADVKPHPGGALDDFVPSDERRESGAYFTPRPLAERLAELAVAPDATGRVVDLSCGSGALLYAAAVRAHGVEVVGVERDLVFAVAAATRLADHRARIIWGDGLAQREELRESIAVVGNPPYVGEKGNRELFASVRAAHPDLARCFGPRIDLHYLFIHRGLDLLADGGRLVYLTSEYWLTATGAGELRRDLCSRTEDRQFFRLGAGAFASAPGQHSLIFAGTARAQLAIASSASWHPFTELTRADDGVALGDVCHDRQGFVSGADRVTNRTSRTHGLVPDRPIFVWRAAEVPAADADLFRPLVRRSDCVANHVFVEPPGRDYVLWCDGTEPDVSRTRIEAYLEPYRVFLKTRREVKRGVMRWSRIWWPRVTDEYQRPKLVVPRRATAPAFCLDLSGSHVSSDCTFLLAPDDVEDEIAWLVCVMVAANSDEAEAQLRAFGKTKGEIIEFYSDPLRRWNLPLRRDGDDLRLTDPALAEEAARILAAIHGPTDR